jgi:serine phosphatase RsbU (regulator of sigma subunit)
MKHFALATLLLISFQLFSHEIPDTIVTKQDSNFKEQLTIIDVFFGKEDAYQVCYPKNHREFFYGIFGLLGITLTLGTVIIYIKSANSKKLKQKNQLIEKQNHEILDSITYAKRIQQAILPNEKHWGEILQSSFVYYKPKDIVAGDFYWMEETVDYTFVAAADCTGHGVPGAMLSVLCSNALSKTVTELHIHETNLILDRTRQLLLDTLLRNEDNIYDGMDISLIRINKKNPQDVQFSGANNSMIVINSSNELTEVKADKQPVGKYLLEKPFTATNLNLDKDSMLYLFSDGYADQFGGTKGKKFMRKNLHTLFTQLASSDIAKQQSKLDQTLNSWKQSFEQVDDILVIGIRLS